MTLDKEVIKIDPLQYPPHKGESWRIVHPNDGYVEFMLPPGAVSVCFDKFYGFEEGIAYSCYHSDDEGWVCVERRDAIVEMPEYIFNRFFDSLPFVMSRQRVTEEDLQNATPFDYRSTLPMPPKIEFEFKDKETRCDSGKDR